MFGSVLEQVDSRMKLTTIRAPHYSVCIVYVLDLNVLTREGRVRIRRQIPALVKDQTMQRLIVNCFM